MTLRLALLVSIIGAARAAHACGGGVVTIPSGTIAADAQRILISVHGGVTDVITQIGVPETTANYGVLIPVPGEPTLDAKPVPSSELETLFSERLTIRAPWSVAQTRPAATFDHGP